MQKTPKFIRLYRRHRLADSKVETNIGTGIQLGLWEKIFSRIRPNMTEILKANYKRFNVLQKTPKFIRLYRRHRLADSKVETNIGTGIELGLWEKNFSRIRPKMAEILKANHKRCANYNVRTCARACGKSDL